MTVADLPEGDEGWLCPSCDAKVDALWAINNAFGWSWPLDTPWNVFFLDEAEEGAPAADGGLAQEPDWPSDDSQDEDFHPNEPHAEALSDGQGAEGGAEREGARRHSRASSLSRSTASAISGELTAQPTPRAGASSWASSGTGGSGEVTVSGGTVTSRGEVPSARARAGSSSSSLEEHRTMASAFDSPAAM